VKSKRHHTDFLGVHLNGVFKDMGSDSLRKIATAAVVMFSICPAGGLALVLNSGTWTPREEIAPGVLRLDGPSLFLAV